MQHRYQHDLRHQKQQKKRRQATNHQIWQRLQALIPRAEETATLLMQLTKVVEERTRIHHPGEDLLGKVMAGWHWAAIGDDEAQEKASVGRNITNGVLFRLAVLVVGRKLIALIDSGASQSYMAPETVALCEVKCSLVMIHLELADGSKIQVTQKTLAVPCTVGKSICNISFTVTRLLSNVAWSLAWIV